MGYVDAAYVLTLVGFGLTRDQATLGVAAYRFAQFFFPIFLGAIAYASLRFGPWKIEKRDRLSRLRELAKTEPGKGESKIDFALRFGQRERPTPVDINPELAEEIAADERTASSRRDPARSVEAGRATGDRNEAIDDDADTA